jgi:hypothetical protein
VHQHRRHPYWAECRWLTEDLRVLVGRYGKKYYATNHWALKALEVRRLYCIMLACKLRDSF